MEQELSTPKLVRATEAFNRKTLRKMTLALFDNDIFQVTGKILDRDTLKVTVVISHYTKPSMQALAIMYMKEFLNTEEFVLEDWLKKSGTAPDSN